MMLQQRRHIRKRLIARQPPAQRRVSPDSR